MRDEWSAPKTAQIPAGQNTPHINIAWGIFTENVEFLLATIFSEQIAPPLSFQLDHTKPNPFNLLITIEF